MVNEASKSVCPMCIGSGTCFWAWICYRTTWCLVMCRITSIKGIVIKTKFVNEPIKLRLIAWCACSIYANVYGIWWLIEDCKTSRSCTTCTSSLTHVIYPTSDIIFISRIYRSWNYNVFPSIYTNSTGTAIVRTNITSINMIWNLQVDFGIGTYVSVVMVSCTVTVSSIFAK